MIIAGPTGSGRSDRPVGCADRRTSAPGQGRAPRGRKRINDDKDPRNQRDVELTGSFPFPQYYGFRFLLAPPAQPIGTRQRGHTMHTVHASWGQANTLPKTVFSMINTLQKLLLNSQSHTAFKSNELSPNYQS